MRVVLLVLAALALPGAARSDTTPYGLGGGTTKLVELTYRAHDGLDRPAWLLLPVGYHGQRIPLVISPHGRGVDAISNALGWGELPGEGGFAVVNPGGQGRRLADYSWGDPGEIADLARMPRIVEAYGVRVERSRIYAIGGSMGGQETLLLVARYPHLLAGAVAFDPATDMTRRYWDFASLRHGGRLQALAREEIGGTPGTEPEAYDVRSPDHYARAIADSGVPLQLYWSTADRVIVDQRVETDALYALLRDFNPRDRVWDFEGEWAHTAEMQPTRRMPRALARFGLLPWKDVPRLPRPSRGLAA